MKKVFLVIVVFTVIMIAVSTMMHISGDFGPSTDPCGDWVNRHMPDGAFLVLRTGNQFLIDHDGSRYGVACHPQQDGSVKMTVAK